MGGNSGKLFTKGISFDILSKESRVGNPEYDDLTRRSIYFSLFLNFDPIECVLFLKCFVSRVFLGFLLELQHKNRTNEQNFGRLKIQVVPFQGNVKFCEFKRRTKK